MVKTAATALVDVVVEGVLNGNSWITGRKLSVHLDDYAAVVKAFEIRHVSKPLQGHSRIQFILYSLLRNR